MTDKIIDKTRYYIITERREPNITAIISNYSVSKATYDKCLKIIHETKKRKEGYV